MAWLCRILEISRSGYYAWLRRGTSCRERRDHVLARELVRLHQKYPAMGLDSLFHLLKPVFHCSRKRVHRLIKKLGIHSLRKKAYKENMDCILWKILKMGHPCRKPAGSPQILMAPPEVRKG